jgi:hypothetical protein
LCRIGGILGGVGIINSGATNKVDISDEELKQLVGHDPAGNNMIVFALAILSEFQKRGIAPITEPVCGRGTAAREGKYLATVQGTSNCLL